MLPVYLLPMLAAVHFAEVLAEANVRARSGRDNGAGTLVAAPLVERGPGEARLDAQRPEAGVARFPFQCHQQVRPHAAALDSGSTKNVASASPSRAAVPIRRPPASATRQYRSRASVRSFSGVK